MVLGNSYGKLLNIVGSILVFGVIIGLAYLSTARIKKATPVDAIRNGETGERFKKKKGYRISKSHAKNTLYLAWNDIVSSPKRFLNIIISFGICSLFLLVLANTKATMDSNSFVDTFGTRSDLYVDEIGENAIDYSSFTDEKKIDIRYSQQKLDAVRGLFTPKKYEFLTKIISSMPADQNLNSEEAINYLTRYSNNLITVSPLQRIDINSTEQNKTSLFRNYIYEMA
jgi:hypothetical protein